MQTIDFTNYYWQNELVRLRALQPDDWRLNFQMEYDSVARRRLEYEQELPPTEENRRAAAEHFSNSGGGVSRQLCKWNISPMIWEGYNTTTSAAAVLPTATLNEVISKARTMGGLLPVCRGFNIPTKMSIPVGTPATKAAWHVEGTPVESDQNTVVSVSFSGYEIIKIFSISVAARRMSISAFESYMIDELTACVMECIAAAIVSGTGSGQGTGLITGITWTAENSLQFPADGLTYPDVTKTAAKLARGYSAGARWAMNNATLYNSFYGLVDDTGRPIFISDPQSDNVGRILGYDVVVDDNLPDDNIIFGNFQYMGYNIPEGIMIETSRESSFKSGLIDYRAMAVADCKPIVPEAFVRLTRSVAP